MRRRPPLSVLLISLLLGACSSGSDAVTEQRTPMPATLPGVYAGEFPCSNCAAIAATLWLRPDGAFFLRQEFAGGASATPAATKPQTESVTYGLGRWSWDEVGAEIVLRGAGPERRLTVRDQQHILLRAASPTEHILVRDAAAPQLEDRLTLDGESAVTEKGATFRECLTGLTLEVADSGVYRELRRQHRRMNPRGRIALTTIEGHLVTAPGGATTSERLVIDRFITMKPGTGC